MAIISIGEQLDFLKKVDIESRKNPLRIPDPIETQALVELTPIESTLLPFFVMIRQIKEISNKLLGNTNLAYKLKYPLTLLHNVDKVSLNSRLNYDNTVDMNQAERKPFNQLLEEIVLLLNDVEDFSLGIDPPKDIQGYVRRTIGLDSFGTPYSALGRYIKKLNLWYAIQHSNGHNSKHLGYDRELFLRYHFLLQEDGEVLYIDFSLKKPFEGHEEKTKEFYQLKIHHSKVNNPEIVNQEQLFWKTVFRVRGEMHRSQKARKIYGKIITTSLKSVRFELPKYSCELETESTIDFIRKYRKKYFDKKEEYEDRFLS